MNSSRSQFASEVQRGGALRWKPVTAGVWFNHARYDAENRLVQSTHVNGGVVTYEYDGNGRRVKKDGSLGTVKYVYDAMGQMVAELGGVGSAGVAYLSGDHLGTTRLVTDGFGAVVKRYDYAPFGEEVPKGEMGRPAGTEYPAGVYPATGAEADGVAVKFTGKERDAETGLDFFGARYMSSAQGRFTSPDAPFADQRSVDPQSWNLYAYGRNNPLRFVDFV